MGGEVWRVIPGDFIASTNLKAVQCEITTHMKLDRSVCFGPSWTVLLLLSHNLHHIYIYIYCIEIKVTRKATPAYPTPYLIYSQLFWQIESYRFLWISNCETMLLGLAYLVCLPRPGSKASCLSRSAITGCSWWELVYSSKAVGSKMIHRRCKSLPNPHPSIAAMLLMSAFSP